jgi:hypothetical protein
LRKQFCKKHHRSPIVWIVWLIKFGFRKIWNRKTKRFICLKQHYKTIKTP